MGEEMEEKEGRVEPSSSEVATWLGSETGSQQFDREMASET